MLILAGLLSWAIAPASEATREGFAMNTIIRMTVYGKESVLDDAYNLLNELDSRLSMYNPSSDLSAITANAGIKSVDVPADVVEAVRDSVRLYEVTGGVFNPMIGPVTRLWKINRADNTIPSHEDLESALALSSIGNLEIGEGYIYLREKGCVIDLGGIAKGYASSRIAQLMRDKGITSGLIDLGGNIYTVGKKPDGSEWKIGVRNPFEPYGSPALALKVNDCAVVTSGGYERFKVVDGKRYTHFFDPKTGESVMSDVLSVTLVTPDGSLADGLATAFMISGFDEASKVLAKLPPETGAVFIREASDGKPEVLITSNLRNAVFAERLPITYFDPQRQ